MAATDALNTLDSLTRQTEGLITTPLQAAVIRVEHGNDC